MTGRTPAVGAVDLDQLGAPLVVCSARGHVRAATTLARQLLGADSNTLALPDKLWWALDNAPAGRMIEWRPRPATADVIGCTRYEADDGYVVVLCELADQHAALSRRLHRHRLETTGRLVASIAHELRNSLATIVYNADFLAVAGSRLSTEIIQETANEMVVAGRRIQLTVDGLLDLAHMGPSIAVPVSLREVLTRAERFVCTLYGRQSHQVDIDIEPEAEWVRGNSLTIEQVFVNLLSNAVEASQPSTVAVNAAIAREDDDQAPAPAMVRVRLRDDGPGIPPELRDSVFQPFFTTRDDGTGLGLPHACEAAESLGGALHLDSDGPGACFSVYLPRGDRR